MSNDNPIGTKTRWGELIEILYNFCYDISPYGLTSSSINAFTGLAEHPNIEINFVFLDNEGTRRRVLYEAKYVNKSVLTKKFLKNMRKPTSVLIEGFPQTVIVDEVKFKLCSVTCG